MSIVDLAVSRAREEGARVVSEVEVAIGPLAGVLPDALQFCFSAASRETLAAGATLVIVEQQANAQCRDCGVRFTADSFIPVCNACTSNRVAVSGGDELKVLSVTIE